MIRIFARIAVVSLFIITVPSASAQFVGSPDEVIASGTSYFIFAQRGEPTVTVHLLGDISSGVYVLGSETNILDLLTLAGGAQLGQGAQERRSYTVRVFRETGGTRSSIYESELRQMLREPGAYPPLRDGDVVTVESVTRQRLGFTAGLQIVTSLSTVVLLVLRLVEGR